MENLKVNLSLNITLLYHRITELSYTCFRVSILVSQISNLNDACLTFQVLHNQWSSYVLNFGVLHTNTWLLINNESAPSPLPHLQCNSWIFKLILIKEAEAKPIGLPESSI